MKVNILIVKQWLAKADKDLKIAQEDFKKPDRAEYVAFNCQQATEKYLKAYIVSNNLDFKRTPDLVELVRICAQKDSDFNRLKPFVEELTPFYIESRYPEFMGTITQQDAKRALAAAKKIADLVKDKIRIYPKMGTNKFSTLARKK